METALFRDIVAVFILSVVVLLVCFRLRIPPIVGLLITGVCSGPSAFGLVTDVQSVEMLSEIGIVFLLFTIGMELSGSEFARLKGPIFLNGTCQVVVSICIFGICYILLVDCPWEEGVFYGCLSALSSTAIVLSLQQQSGQTESPSGHLSLAILIFQDIAVVPMMLAIPLLAHQSANTSFWGLFLGAGKAMLLLGCGWILAEKLLPKIMYAVVRTRSRELLVTSTLTLCMSIALGTASLGLSVSLGAFLAGLLLSESEYSLEVIDGILPFKDFFTSLFFISVGMLLDVHFFLTHIVQVLVWAAVVLGLKTLVVVAIALWCKYPLRVAIRSGMSLSQIGEFSFVLAGTGLAAGLLPPDSYQLFLAGSILTMTLTPIMMHMAPLATRYAERLVRLNPLSEDDTMGHEPPLSDHLVIVGFGVGGSHLAETAREAHIPYVVLEINPETVKRYRAQGEHILYGDATRELVLEHVGISRARVLAVVISDPAAIRAITSFAKKLNPGLYIVVRTHFLAEVAELRDLGADVVVPEDFETSMEIFNHVLGRYLVPRQTIEDFARRIRETHAVMARSPVMGVANVDALTAALKDVQVMTFIVEHDSSVAGKSLSETALRTRFGVTVVGIRRQGRTIPSPSADAKLLPGDVAYLFGLSDALRTALKAFRAPE